MTFLRKALRLMWRALCGKPVRAITYSAQEWDEQFRTGRWNRLSKGQPNTQRIARLIQELQAPGRISSVLDVGCGNGGLAHLVAGKEGISYTGLDISSEAIREASAASPQGTFLVGDAARPNPSLGTYDLVVFNEVIYYMDPVRTLMAYRSHLTPGGHVVISMVRFWRAQLAWYALRSILLPDHRETVRAGNRTWDIMQARYRNP